MIDNNSDFKQDELIEIKLPRHDYEVLKTMIKRENAYNWLISAIRTNILWVIGGGALTFLVLYDKLHLFFNGAVK